MIQSFKKRDIAQHPFEKLEEALIESLWIVDGDMILEYTADILILGKCLVSKQNGATLAHPKTHLLGQIVSKALKSTDDNKLTLPSS